MSLESLILTIVILIFELTTRLTYLCRLLVERLDLVVNTLRRSSIVLFLFDSRYIFLSLSSSLYRSYLLKIFFSFLFHFFPCDCRLYLHLKGLKFSI